MLDDGERLVPGFRDARALRVWAGVRPLFQDMKAVAGHPRPLPRPRAARPRRPRRRQRLHDHHRRQADDLPADGRGHRRRHVPAARRGPAVPHQGGPAARLRGRADLRAALAPRQGRGAPARGAAHLRVRAHRPPRLEETMGRRGTDEPGRHPPQPAAGHGPVSGRLLHLPRRRDPARRAQAQRRRGQPLAAAVPRGALEGRVADPLRGPAAPSALRRMGLPGRARRRAPAHGAAPTEAAPFPPPSRTLRWRHERDRAARGELRRRGHRRGAGGPVGRPPRRGGRRPRARAGQGCRQYAPRAGDDRRPRLRPRPRRRAGRGAPGFVRDHPDHPYAPRGGDVQRAVDWFKARFEAGPLGGYRYEARSNATCCCPRRSACRSPRRWCRRPCSEATCAPAGGSASSGSRLYKDLSASFLADNLSRAGLGIEARSVELDVRPEGRSDPNSVGFARAVEDPAFRTTLADALAGKLERGGARGPARGVRPARPRGGVDATSSSGSSAPVFEIPRCRPRCPGSAFTAR